MTPARMYATSLNSSVKLAFSSLNLNVHIAANILEKAIEYVGEYAQQQNGEGEVQLKYVKSGGSPLGK